MGKIHGHVLKTMNPAYNPLGAQNLDVWLAFANIELDEMIPQATFDYFNSNPCQFNLTRRVQGVRLHATLEYRNFESFDTSGQVRMTMRVEEVGVMHPTTHRVYDDTCSAMKSCV
jgi:hypothetical protein